VLGIVHPLTFSLIGIFDRSKIAITVIIKFGDSASRIDDLLDFARERSFELGYGGLVGLHALSESVSFYAKIGMIGGDPDPDRDGLPYFEWYRRQE
jgi:hypothetical protein